MPDDRVVTFLLRCFLPSRGRVICLKGKAKIYPYQLQNQNLYCIARPLSRHFLHSRAVHPCSDGFFHLYSTLVPPTQRRLTFEDLQVSPHHLSSPTPHNRYCEEHQVFHRRHLVCSRSI